MLNKNKKLLRKIQKYIQETQNAIKFKTSHISTWWKIVLIGSLVTFFSLFIPWISPLDTVISCGYSDIPTSNSFSKLLWWVWFFIIIILAIISFSLFSIQRKEKLHFFSHIRLPDMISALLGSILIFILTFHSFFIISWLQFFSVNILYWKGLILCITWSIVIGIWALIMKKEYRKNIKWSYISEVKKTENLVMESEEKHNMKFPF